MFHAADLFGQNGPLFLTESLPVSDRAERFRHQVPMPGQRPLRASKSDLVPA